MTYNINVGPFYIGFPAPAFLPIKVFATMNNVNIIRKNNLTNKCGPADSPRHVLYTTTRTRRATTGLAAPSGWTGSTPLRVRTVFFEAVMFLLHCYPHIVLFTPRVVSSLSPQLIRSCSRLNLVLLDDKIRKL